MSNRNRSLSWESQTQLRAELIKVMEVRDTAARVVARLLGDNNLTGAIKALAKFETAERRIKKIQDQLGE